jgi:lipid II:glycine glycyltransferase (peptidoglycan interpeptide bridge formation enzyme)
LDYQARILTGGELRDWDEFVASHSLGNVHQTSRWGEFQSKKGPEWKFWVIGIMEKGKLSGGAMVLRRRLPLGRCWLYIPKGPLLNYDKAEAEQQLAALLDNLKELAGREKAIFLRVEPGLVAAGPKNFGLQLDFDWKKAGFRPAHAHYQPENTLVVDLEKEDKAILEQMKPKGRYNIKVAEKKSLELLTAGKELTLEEGTKAFHQLLGETFARDRFAGHPEQYYREMLTILGKDEAQLYLARFEGKIIAGILVTFYRDLAIYYFGASSNQHRNVMAPYLLQWKAMQEAKKRGQKWYDFLGTAPLSETDGEYSFDEKHSWAGVTGFKLKFGGQKVDFYPGQEIVYSPWFYWLMRLRKRLRG